MSPKNLVEALELHQPFLNNVHTEAYLRYVSKIWNRDGEKHHILPRSMFPQYTDCSWNIVNLSYEDHYTVHSILPFMLEEGSRERTMMLRAWRLMSHTRDAEPISQIMYAKLKREMRKVETSSRYLKGLVFLIYAKDVKLERYIQEDEFYKQTKVILCDEVLEEAYVIEKELNDTSSDVFKQVCDHLPKIRKRLESLQWAEVLERKRDVKRKRKAARMAKELEHNKDANVIYLYPNDPYFPTKPLIPNLDDMWE